METFTKQQLMKIEEEARELRSPQRKASICITTDYDDETDKFMITELYISTSGMWLRTQEETEEYIKQLQECQEFINKYANKNK